MRRSRYRRPSLPGLRREVPADAPAHVRGDYPEWLAPEFERAFGARAGEEGAALARRAPVDLRVEYAEGRPREGAEGAARASSRGPRRFRPSGCVSSLRRDPAKPACRGRARSRQRLVRGAGRGLAARHASCGRAPRQQVIDLCAGAGGKTLALAAPMQTPGQLYAYDSTACGSADLRAAEAGRACATPRSCRPGTARPWPLSTRGSTSSSSTRPVRGSGAWRRRPDAKWRPAAMLEARQAEQRRFSSRARGSSRRAAGSSTPPARCCRRRTATRWMAFSRRHSEFKLVPWAGLWEASLARLARSSLGRRLRRRCFR